MRLRPIQGHDAVALTRLYDRLSPETAYQRFFAAMRRLPPDWARVLAEVDDDRRAALVALDPAGDLIAVARYGAPPGSDEAEIALVVQDAWQNRGLGTVLLGALLDRAAMRGIARFVAYVLSDNRRMQSLIARLGHVTARSADQGVVTLRVTRRPDSEEHPPEPAAERRSR